MYTVSQAEGLTGIPSTTLRAWERRYGIIAPRRTEGGYRLYDAAQIATLREMAARVQGGMRPAQAAASLIDQQPPTPTPATPLDAGTPDLVAAAASLDPTALRETIDEAFGAEPFEDVVTTWLLPQLRLLGEAWQSGRLTVAQEHFASAGLMAAVAAAYRNASGESRGPTVLVGLPAGARHQLAILAFATCLRRLGSNALYLGADLPTEDWAMTARGQRARAVVLGVYSPADAATATLVVEALADSAVPVWVGGASAAGVRGAAPLPDDLPEAAHQLNQILLLRGLHPRATHMT